MKAVAGMALTTCAALTLASCGEDHACLALPCAMPAAVEVRITWASGDPVAGATVRVTGATTTTVICNGGALGNMCVVPGVGGSYQLEVGASGYQTTRRSVTVVGSTPACGCPQVQTEHLDLVLVRAEPPTAG